MALIKIINLSITLLIFITGCAVSPEEQRRIDSVIQPTQGRDPTISNPYGEFIHGPAVNIDQQHLYAQNKCSLFGGLNYQSLIVVGSSNLGSLDGAHTQGYIKRFRCNGIGSSAERGNNKSVSQESGNKILYDSSERINAATTTIDNPKNESKPIEARDSLTIERAKVKCNEIGIKSGTPNFGKCVLQLTK